MTRPNGNHATNLAVLRSHHSKSTPVSRIAWGFSFLLHLPAAITRFSIGIYVLHYIDVLNLAHAANQSIQ